MATIGQLIAYIETKGNFEAVRFEPAKFNALIGKDGMVDSSHVAGAHDVLVRIMTIHTCSWHTAAMIYASSWGAHQIMGFNLYGALGYQRSVAHYLANDLDQSACFIGYLAHTGMSNVTPEQLAADQHERLNFAIKFNGSIAYVQPMVDALRHFGYTVVNLTV